MCVCLTPFGSDGLTNFYEHVSFFAVISWKFKAMKSMCISNPKVVQNLSSNKFLVSHYILYDFTKFICKREIQF